VQFPDVDVAVVVAKENTELEAVLVADEDVLDETEPEVIVELVIAVDVASACATAARAPPATKIMPRNKAVTAMRRTKLKEILFIFLLIICFNDFFNIKL